ncbi:hypothetical protein IWQ61_003537 [Dispira simplex]|nr:hypothetical protein IWQ61_003537 [Dispira simplex]
MTSVFCNTLARTSPRLGFPVSLPLVSFRGYASKSKRKYSGPTTDPEIFTQRVILTDGSSITLRTTSPRPQIKLTKDTRNHPLWNPWLASMGVDDTDRLQKFASKFGDAASLEGLSFTESDNVEEDLKAMRTAAAAVEIPKDGSKSK